MLHKATIFDCIIHKPILFVCIGTPRSNGDSIGPRVGDMLMNSNYNNIKVIGTMKNPIHALNLTEKLEYIKKEYKRHEIIAIDAFVSNDKEIGEIVKINGPIRPGAGLGKNLPLIGDRSIIINVANLDQNLNEELYNMDLSMAKKLSDKLYSYIEKNIL